MAAIPRSTYHTYRWLATLTMTADPRGDLVETLRNRGDLPTHFPNQAYLYRFVRDRFKKAERDHLDAVPALYDEYRSWCAADQCRLAEQRMRDLQQKAD